MRRYDIKFLDAITGMLLLWVTSTNADSTVNTGALQVEFDIPTATYASPLSAAYLRVYGLPLATVATANKLNGSTVIISAGMHKGLPLANPLEYGLIAKGTVLQAFGNWIGAEQTLEIQMMPLTGSSVQTPVYSALPQNALTKHTMSLNIKKGTPILDIATNILTAYYGSTFSIDTLGVGAKDLVLTENVSLYHKSLQEFAVWLKKYTQGMRKATSDGRVYSGYEIDSSKGVIRIIDNELPPFSAPSSIIILKPEEFIGQPTWVGVVSVQATVVLRSDIKLGDMIQFPKMPTISTSSVANQYRQSSVFSTMFQVLGTDASIRHVGNFRSADSKSWVTVINAVQTSQINSNFNYNSLNVGNIA